MPRLVGSRPPAGRSRSPDLAADVRAILGVGTAISYAADWSEYFGHQPADGSGDVHFHLDPLWADAAWALGVWGAVAGSVLLLLRSRYAFHAFVASFVGLVVAMVYYFANPLPGISDSALAMIFTVVVVVVTLLLIWYARRMTAAGVLR